MNRPNGSDQTHTFDSGVVNAQVRLSALEAELKHLATKSDLTALEATMHKAMNSQLRWLLAFQTGIVAAGLGAVATIVKVLG